MRPTTGRRASLTGRRTRPACDGDAFAKGRDFAAWLGLVPKQISTGDRTILGKISKRGNRYLRVLFVQAAWVVLIKPKSWETRPHIRQIGKTSCDARPDHTNGSNASFPAWRRLDRFTPMNGHVRPCSARLSRATNRHLRCASSRGAIAPFKIARSATATRIWPFTPSANTRSARCRRAPGWTSSPQERV